MGVESWEKFVQTSMATDPTIRSRHKNGKKKREKRLVLRYLRHSVVQQLRTPSFKKKKQLRTPSNAASGTAASN
jgi:rRNA pseudouridine-1189 N-methylase Emg1 (Nep1/Mra1 family)